MRKRLLDFFFLSGGSSIDYYVAEGASGVGTQADPMSFTAAIAAVQANQTIALNRGDVFDISKTTVPFSGITFTAYGTGANPKLRGSYDIGGNTWTLSGSFYYTTLASEPKWVMKNGRELRQGQSDWISIIASPAANQRTGTIATLDAFNGVESLVGAKIRYEEFDFRMSYENVITAYGSGTGVITAQDNFVGAAVGRRLFLYGQQQFATKTDDWWWDSANSRLYIRASSSPAGSDIRVISEDYGLIVDKANVTIEDVDFQHFYMGAYEVTANNFVNTGSTISNCRFNGMYLYGALTGISIQDFTISQIGGSGILFAGLQGATFNNFTISDIGVEKNYPWPVSSVALKTSGISINSYQNSSNPSGEKVNKNIVITNGSAERMGYSCLVHIGINWTITNVIGDDFCRRWTDGGGFTSFHTAALDSYDYTGDSTLTNVMMINGNTGNLPSSNLNIAGFYFDLNSRNFTLNNCVAFNNYGQGFYCNGEFNNISFNNCLAMGNRYNEFMFYKYTSGSGIAGNDGYNCHVNNCTIVTTNQSGRCISISGYGATDPFDSGGSINNNHYANAYEASIIATAKSGLPYTSATTTYDLAGWRTKTGGDAASTNRVNYFTNYGEQLAIYKDHQLITNRTASAVNYDYTGFDDPEGNAITTGSLAAYSAMIIVRDTQNQDYLLLDTYTASDGTLISGRSPNVGNMPITVVAGANITSNKMQDGGTSGSVEYNVGAAYEDVLLSIEGSSNASENLALNLFLADSTNRVVFLTTDKINITLRDYPNSATPTETTHNYEDLSLNGATITNQFIIRFIRSGTTLNCYMKNLSIGKRAFDLVFSETITNSANDNLILSVLNSGTVKKYDFVAVE